MIRSVLQPGLSIAFCIAVLLAACTSGERNPNAEKGVGGMKNNASLYTVKIEQMKFSPDVLSVRKGDTVMWVNLDLVAHNVTQEKPNGWSSSLLDPGKSWKLVVDDSATYYCSIHQVMKGKIVLK